MRSFIAFFTALFLVGCSVVDVNVDYDEQYGFENVTTFKVVHNAKEGESTLVNDRITAAIEHTLVAKGYNQAKNDVDLVFVYHYSAKDKVDIRTDYQMVGYGGFGYGGAMVATTNSYNYTEGTVIIDAYNPKTKKIVWRSVGVLELQEKKTPREKTEYINKIIEKMMQEYPLHATALKH